MKLRLYWERVWIPVVGAITAEYFMHDIAITVAVFIVLSAVVWWGMYFSYIKDNPKGYWFKRKLYGWGWTPATWQGWLVTVVYVVLVLRFALQIEETATGKEVLETLLLPLLVLTTILIVVAYKTGEKPKWQWGPDEEK